MTGLQRNNIKRIAALTGKIAQLNDRMVLAGCKEVTIRLTEEVDGLLAEIIENVKAIGAI